MDKVPLRFTQLAMEVADKIATIDDDTAVELFLFFIETFKLPMKSFNAADAKVFLRVLCIP